MEIYGQIKGIICNVECIMNVVRHPTIMAKSLNCLCVDNIFPMLYSGCDHKTVLKWGGRGKGGEKGGGAIRCKDGIF